MTPSTRLGGFKILKNVVRFPLILPLENPQSLAQLCRLIADHRINLPYINCVNDGSSWGLNVMVDSSNEARISHLIQQGYRNISSIASESAILSIFPHRNNPEITGSLFEVFGEEGIDPDGFANSPSAISVVLKRGIIKRASNALFGPFSFSAYRTPADWTLAQKGKEQLYKEVVASYQEKKPKVYGLECQERQEFLQLKLDVRNFGQFGSALKEFARLGLNLPFLALSPYKDEKKDKLVFSLPSSQDHSYAEIINRISPDVVVESTSSVATFSMNGPHFGDRYGIASELLDALNESGVNLLGLNCTIASIIGVVPDHQISSAIQAIEGCFEVPSVTRK